MTALYELRCTICRFVTERFMRFDAVVRCPRCYDANYAAWMHRVISAPAIRGTTVSKP